MTAKTHPDTCGLLFPTISLSTKACGLDFMSPPCIITPNAPCHTTQVIDSLPFLPLIVLNSSYGGNNNTQGKLSHFLPETELSKCAFNEENVASDLKVSF